MKTIGIFTSKHGHESISEAIAEKIKQKFKNKYKIKTFVYKQPFDPLYDYIYRLSPSSFNILFETTERLIKNGGNARKMADSFLMLSDEEKIKSFIKNNKPDLFISTYFGCNPILEKLQRENGTPFINVTTDPRTPHSITISEKANANLVFDDQIIKKHKNKNMVKAGWFVRKRFEEKYSKKEIRKKLKISDELTFLITSGSEGANAILKILPSIINCNRKVNFIVACGNNTFLYNNILGIKQSLKKLSSSKAEIIPLAFTKKMHLYMQAADLVIGKAGPNTVFESIASETPFFAITHIHGQENGNLDIIKDFKIGFVEENAKRANKKIEQLIKNPKNIKVFSQSIKDLKKYNQNSINILFKEIKKLID